MQWTVNLWPAEWGREKEDGRVNKISETAILVNKFAQEIQR